MTLWDTLAALGRRWYVVLAGAACTALALSAVLAVPGVYTSRTQVVFLAPSSASYPNVLRTTSGDLIVTAGIVAKRINGTRSTIKTAESQVSLVGRGVTDGVSVTLPDNGGQWASNFNVQALDVQVTAATVDEVRTRQEAIFQRIEAELTALQDDAGVADVNRITTEVVPAAPGVRYMRGDPRRALLMTAILGASITLLVVSAVELRSARRHGADPRPARASTSV